jgi:hypothetical protein
MNGWMEQRKGGRKDGWMDGWMDDHLGRWRKLRFL